MSNVSEATKRVAEGPPGLPLLGSFFPMMEDPLALAIRAHAEYGDVVRIHVRNIPMVLLRHPHDVKRVLIDEAPAFFKPRVRNVFNGNGLAVSEGEFWKRQRHLVQPMFSKEKVRGWSGIFGEELRKGLVRWRGLAEEGRPLDVYMEASRMMFGVLWRISFDEHPDEAQFTTVLDAVRQFGTRTPPLQALLYALVPALHPGPQRNRAAIKPINEWIYTRLAERRARELKDGESTLLSMLVEARARGTGEAMTDEEVRDEIVNLFGASFEMIGTTLTWAIYLLAKHPEVMGRVREEVRSVAGPESLVAHDDAMKLTYTYRVLQEVLRLYPPAWMLPRATRDGCTFGSLTLAPKTKILIFPYAIHRHPEFWTSPETFDPDRFLPERSGTIHKCAYIPFGAGQRLCVGQHMSVVETLQALAAMVGQLDLSLVSQEPVKLDTRLTMSPQGGLPVRAKVVRS